MSEIEKAKEQFEKAKARLKKAQSKVAAQDRKKDTRRKIILGGLILAQAKQNEQTRNWITSKIATLSERDQKLFDGWEP